jgi:hypothetical protein
LSFVRPIAEFTAIESMNRLPVRLTLRQSGWSQWWREFITIVADIGVACLCELALAIGRAFQNRPGSHWGRLPTRLQCPRASKSSAGPSVPKRCDINSLKRGDEVGGDVAMW